MRTLALVGAIAVVVVLAVTIAIAMRRRRGASDAAPETTVQPSVEVQPTSDLEAALDQFAGADSGSGHAIDLESVDVDIDADDTGPMLQRVLDRLADDDAPSGATPPDTAPPA